MYLFSKSIEFSHPLVLPSQNLSIQYMVKQIESDWQTYQCIISVYQTMSCVFNSHDAIFPACFCYSFCVFSQIFA